MSQISSTVAAPTTNDKRLILLIPAAAGLTAWLASLNPLWALAGFIVLAVTVALAKLPEASTLTVLFILYTNAAAVAVQFHGVPYILGASFFLLLIIPLFDYVILRREKLIVPPILLLMALWVLIQLTGALLARHPEIALKELAASLVEGLMLFFLVINVIRTPETLRRVVWVLLIAGVGMSLAPLYQQATGQFHREFAGFGQVSDAAFFQEAESQVGPLQPRLAGSIGEQNRFAQVMLMLVPLALFRWWGERSGQLRMLALGATILILVAVILTFSRGAAIGIVVIVLALGFLGFVRLERISLVLFGLALLLLAIPQYVTRISSLQRSLALAKSQGVERSDVDGSTKSRLTEMGAAGLVFMDAPLLGVGPGMFRYHYREYAEQIGGRIMAEDRRSHSLFPDIAAEAGFFGLTVFCVMLYITFRDLLRAYRKWKGVRPDLANLAASFALVFIAYMSTAMFLHMAYIRYFWLMMALANVASRMGGERAPATTAVNSQLADEPPDASIALGLEPA